MTTNESAAKHLHERITQALREREQHRAKAESFKAQVHDQTYPHDKVAYRIASETELSRAGVLTRHIASLEVELARVTGAPVQPVPFRALSVHGRRHG